MTNYAADLFGANPVNIQWTIVRGDTGVLRVEFYEDDESTPYDTEDWEFVSTTYDFKGDVLDELEVETSEGFVTITAPADTTKFWGLGYKAVVAELAFDLQVTIDDVIWTPVVGTIKVVGDISGGSL
jgi:hypothetical protein